jgi:omega-6 fatty acid desaturase (delta-12 desaturase)
MKKELPSRREIKKTIRPFNRRLGVPEAMMKLSIDALGWFFSVALVVVGPWWLKPFAALACAMYISRLFVLGHDACHGSLTANPKANKTLGRIAFLPSLTAYSLWEIGHNVAHHGYNNLRTHDFVWAPLDPLEYAQLNSWRRLLYKLYRSGWAPGLYYLVEIWWKKLFFPNAAHMPTRRSIFVSDNWLNAAFLAAWASSLVWAASATQQSALVLLALGLLTPFFVWGTVMGFVTYVQHTHPSVKWYADKTEWGQDRAHLSATVHLQGPPWLNGALHHILEHTAHHVDMSLMHEELPAAQRHLEITFGDSVPRWRWSWRQYFANARQCGVYDYKRHRWLPVPELLKVEARYTTLGL